MIYAKKHKWYHFIFGTDKRNREVIINDYMTTNEFWDICSKCGKQVSPIYKSGAVTLSNEKQNG